MRARRAARYASSGSGDGWRRAPRRRVKQCGCLRNRMRHSFRRASSGFVAAGAVPRTPSDSNGNACHATCRRADGIRRSHAQVSCHAASGKTSSPSAAVWFCRSLLPCRWTAWQRAAKPDRRSSAYGLRGTPRRTTLFMRLAVWTSCILVGLAASTRLAHRRGDSLAKQPMCALFVAAPGGGSPPPRPPRDGCAASTPPRAASTPPRVSPSPPPTTRALTPTELAIGGGPLQSRGALPPRRVTPEIAGAATVFGIGELIVAAPAIPADAACSVASTVRPKKIFAATAFRRDGIAPSPRKFFLGQTKKI